MELSERLGLCPGRERIVSIVGAGRRMWVCLLYTSDAADD